MSQETLETAARRVIRFCRIDEERGGLITEPTLLALTTLDKMLRSRMQEIDHGQVYVVDVKGNVFEARICDRRQNDLAD
jgi:hypothetical protein